MKTDVDEDHLLQEYFHLQKTVEEFDQRALTINGWSVTVSMAAIGTAFTAHTSILLLLAAGSSLLFWIIEALWKSFQLAYYQRIIEIEDYCAGKRAPQFSFPYISHSWSEAWHARPILESFWWYHLCLPHVTIVLLGTALWILNRSSFHWIP